MSEFFSRVVLFGALMMAMGAGPRAADWRDALKLPMSPGSVALLVGHASDPMVVKRWETALRDTNPRVRAAAARMVNVSSASALAPALTAALDTETDGDAAREEVRALAALRGGTIHDILFSAAKALTTQQRDAIEQPTTRRSPPTSTVVPPLRSIGDLPKGLFADLVNAAGCRLGNDRVLVGAQIVYDAVARPRNVSFLKPGAGVLEVTSAKGLSSACEAASQAALLAARGSDLTPAGTTELVVAVMDPEFITCVDDAAGWDAPAPQAIRGPTGVPVKVRDVRPVYPRAAQADRVQGIVIAETVLSTSGCVQSARVLRSPDLRLSMAALHAITAWRFGPTLVNGQPVPLFMTVTSDFALR